MINVFCQLTDDKRQELLVKEEKIFTPFQRIFFNIVEKR